MSPSSIPNNPGSFDPGNPRFEVFVPAQTGLPSGKTRLGVLGSAYNPITRAHLLLARYAREQCNLHEVILVLPKILPNKPLVGTTIEQRLEMMQLGTAALPYIALGVCTHGLFLDIFSALQEIYSQESEIFFITGRDAAERILSWPYDDPAGALAQMFAAFQLLIFQRQGKPELVKGPQYKKYADRIHHLEMKENLDHISSTAVRRRIRAGQSIEDLVPKEVAAFIKTHAIYQNISED